MYDDLIGKQKKEKHDMSKKDILDVYRTEHEKLSKYLMREFGDTKTGETIIDQAIKILDSTIDYEKQRCSQCTYKNGGNAKQAKP